MNMENNLINENKVNDFLKDKVFDREKFIQKVKGGSTQTKEAYRLLQNSAVNDIRLSEEEKEFVKKNLKNIFTTLGYGALFMIPGSMTTMALTKLLRPMFKKKSTMNENDKLKGGLADKISKKDIAKKFGVTLAKINKESSMGGDVEMEHVNSKKLAKEIAMDHLVEIPDYYTRLKKMEKEGEKYWKGKEKKVNESIKQFIKRRIRENVSLSIEDESPVTTAFNIIYNGKPAGQIEVGKFNQKLNKDDLEIVIIKVSEQFRGLKIGTETINALWKEFPHINRFILMPTNESYEFWEKMGATRLNDAYHMINRGH